MKNKYQKRGELERKIDSLDLGKDLVDYKEQYGTDKWYVGFIEKYKKVSEEQLKYLDQKHLNRLITY